jgi:phosphate uptake regulator
MDIRNVQQTGDMCYVYLPTRWCKRFNLRAKSKVGVQALVDGGLGIFPQGRELQNKGVSFITNGQEVDSLHKLIIASYISPATSFDIVLEQEMEFSSVLNQKNLVSLELVEIDGNRISCESSMHVNDPLLLMGTMLRKIRNLLRILSNEHGDLIERYEEEVDRSKLLIEKSVVAGLTNPQQADYTAIELHYLSRLSKALEMMVDHLITIDNLGKDYTEGVRDILGNLQDLLKERCKSLDYQAATKFNDKIFLMQNVTVEDVRSYGLRRIARALNSISEVMIDWAVIKEVQR